MALLQANITREMDELMWDEESGMHYDLFLNGSRTPFKTVAALYPLLAAVGTNHLRATVPWLRFHADGSAPQGMNRTRIARIVETLKSPDFWASLFHAVTLDHPCVAQCGVQGWHGAWLTHAVAMQGSLPPRGRATRRAWTVEHGHPGSHEPAQVRAGCVVSPACCLLSVVFAAAPTAPWRPFKSSRPACARRRRS